MAREEILLKDLIYHFPKKYEEKIKSALKVCKEVIDIPISSLNPSTGYHPILVFRKTYGSMKKEIPVSLLEFKILNRYNMPAWKKTITFDLDSDDVGKYNFRNTHIIFIGDSKKSEDLKKVLHEIVERMDRKPKRIAFFYDEVYLECEGNRYIHLKISGRELQTKLENIEPTTATKTFGRALLYIESTFSGKNKEFYKLLFIYSLESRASFESFFMRYVFPHLNPEQRDFLEEMYDYRNFITLLYDNLSRVNKDRIRDEIGIRINRRAPHHRPLDIGIVFTDRGIKVRREINQALITMHL